MKDLTIAVTLVCALVAVLGAMWLYLPLWAIGGYVMALVALGGVLWRNGK